MRVKFYVDVPPYSTPQQLQGVLCAWSNAPQYSPCEGYKRVMFEVDLPVKEFDERVTATTPVLT